MVKVITIADYYNCHEALPVIDVRSPGEFQRGRIPGAVNIALFTNDERAAVGTTYVQTSQEEAIKLGYKFVTPKLGYFIEASREVAKNGPVVVHCWRGGMRSQAFADHLSSNGFKEVYIIKGGYKAFRNYVLKYFEQPFQLRVIGGYTGSGKTEILKVLQTRGEQVIDLEGIAHHKGSAFGAIGEKNQPTSEHFENCLYAAFHQLNINEPIWIEDESMNIGNVNLPLELYRQIREQVVCFIDIPKKERIQNLIKDYAKFGDDVLSKAINRIAKRLGGQHVKAALSFLDEENYFEVANIALQYYDKAYLKGISNRDAEKVLKISLQKCRCFSFNYPDFLFSCEWSRGSFRFLQNAWPWR